MAQFTPISCYSLKTHSIVMDQNGVQVVLDSTGQKVDEALFSSSPAFKIIENDFCFGSVKFNNVVKVNVDLSKPNAGVLFENKGSDSYLIGGDDITDLEITKQHYRLADCPVQITKSGSVLTIRSPRDKKRQ